jgi:hypothetical protein
MKIVISSASAPLEGFVTDHDKAVVGHVFERDRAPERKAG